jgi:predicted GNAT family N-acyltransferase
MSKVHHSGAPAANDTAPEPRRHPEIRVARGFDDLLMVFSIRASVYMAEQDCPYGEEFDGNDHCATHFLGLIDGEPAGCLRVRFFGGFAKIERLAVRKRYRSSSLAFDLVRAGIAHARRKGFKRLYGHSRQGLDSFWRRFGAKPIPGRGPFVFSDYRYTEMMLDVDSPENQISLESGPMVILRPEGDWDRPGILEFSSLRKPRAPVSNCVSEIRGANGPDAL